MSYKDEYFDQPNKNSGRFIDLTGKVFDKLTVIKLVGRRIYNERSSGSALWECKCECGNIKNIPSTQLLRGKTRSCSCYIRQYRSINMHNRYPDKDKTLINQIYLAYKNGAKKRNILFSLSYKDIEELIKNRCYYCNSKSSNIKKTKHHSFAYNGIDRVDNYKGYELNNVVTCCETCNRAKLQMSKEDFLNWIEKVYKNIFGEKNG